MIKIGKINSLKVVKEVDFGVYLDGEEKGEILLPNNVVPENCQVDDILDVLIYLDSEDRIIATTDKPFVYVDEFALLRCVAVTNIGAFLDWGLYKDVLVPFREQKVKMQDGRSYLVYLYLDHESERIVASAKIEKFLDNIIPEYEPGEEVNLIVADQTDLGYKVIINHTHSGILYNDEVFTELNKGENLKGYIKKVRDDDKIDLTLHRYGYRKVEDTLSKIINYIELNGGTTNITDKSAPEIIYDTFGVSKKTFKQAIGALYKQKQIIITENGISLSDNTIKDKE